jgi:hypothetical protein
LASVVMNSRSTTAADSGSAEGAAFLAIPEPRFALRRMTELVVDTVKTLPDNGR